MALVGDVGHFVGELEEIHHELPHSDGQLGEVLVVVGLGERLMINKAVDLSCAVDVEMELLGCLVESHDLGLQG